MKKTNIVYMLLFISSLTFLFYFSINTYESIKTTLDLYIQKVFPSLFLFILFTNIIITTKYIYNLGEYFKFIPKIFKVSANTAIPILIGFLCGFPNSSLIIDKMYEKKAITKKDAYILMSFCNNASPIFIISTVGITMLKNKYIGIWLFIIHILSSIIIGIIVSRISNINIIQDNNTNLKYTTKENIEKINFLDNLKVAILNTFKTMVYILGYMIIFNIFSDVLNSVFPNLSPIFRTLELTKGISNTKNLKYISFLLGFSSFSIIFQIKSSLSKLDYPILKLIFYKLLHGVLSFIIASFVF